MFCSPSAPSSPSLTNLVGMCYLYIRFEIPVCLSPQKHKQRMALTRTCPAENSIVTMRCYGDQSSLKLGTTMHRDRIYFFIQIVYFSFFSVRAKGFIKFQAKPIGQGNRIPVC